MEVICQCDYQDIYRIKDGVLLIINKFKYVTDTEGYRYVHLFDINRSNSKTYAKGCQKSLKILTKAYRYSSRKLYSNQKSEDVVPAGTVIYNGYPVKKVDSNEWTYQIKTTGEFFSGNKSNILDLIYQITRLIKGEE